MLPPEIDSTINEFIFDNFIRGMVRNHASNVEW